MIKKNITFKTPPDWFGSWRNQFYIFDILYDLETKGFDKDDCILILDSDCIITKNLDPIFRDLKNRGVLVYSCRYPDNHVINGITKKQMCDIYNEIYNENKIIDYFGGEFIGLRADMISNILKEFKFLWECNFKLYEKKETKLNEEAHFLSIIYERLNLIFLVREDYIKRIWNTPKYWNAKEKDSSIFILHMPAQKITGFKYFFDKKIKHNKDFQLDDIIEKFYLSDKRKITRDIRDYVTKILFRLDKI